METFGVLLDPFEIATKPDVRSEFVAAVVCPACAEPVCIRLQFGEFPKDYEGMEELVDAFHESNRPPSAYNFTVLETWPVAPEPDIPRHLPAGIEAKLLEAERSYAAQLFTGAAGLYRSLVDLAVKEQIANAGLSEKGMLAARLDRLSENHIIPDAVAAWAHEVRAIGNEALHDELAVSEEDANAIRYFTLTYLRYAYELPGDIAERRAQTAKA